jgi:hypothetical protein
VERTGAQLPVGNPALKVMQWTGIEDLNGFWSNTPLRASATGSFDMAVWGGAAWEGRADGRVGVSVGREAQEASGQLVQ